jgi:hypothetical protein
VNALSPSENFRPGKEFQPDQQDPPVPYLHPGVCVGAS